MSRRSPENKPAKEPPASRKKRISQGDVPKHSLREALTIAQSLTDNFAGDPTAPHQIAMSLNISPTSSSWRSLTGAATAYGLTSGAYNSEKIGLEVLGRRCTAPTEEGDDVTARAQAALTPRLLNDFYKKYNRSKFPPDAIAKNVLQHTFGLTADRIDEVLTLIKDNGSFVGFIHETKTGPFVSIDDLNPSPVTVHENTTSPDERNPNGTEEQTCTLPIEAVNPSLNLEQNNPIEQSSPFRVFITHGKNHKIVEQVKDVLDLYDIDYEVAVEEESPAIPVPQKVLTAMRKCSAGIMIVSADDDAAAESGIINNNVLIEIGTAFVLYDQKVVLLWDRRLKVPSNLQGLYRCEFEGNELSFVSGTKLAKAVKGFKR